MLLKWEVAEQVKKWLRGLHVDTGWWEDNVCLDRKDRRGIVCRSAQQAKDEHCFMFGCPLYTSIRADHASLFQHACSVSDFWLAATWYMWLLPGSFFC